MKIQYASDIHLELSDNSRFIKTMPFEVAGEKGLTSWEKAEALISVAHPDFRVIKSQTNQ